MNRKCSLTQTLFHCLVVVAHITPWTEAKLSSKYVLIVIPKFDFLISDLNLASLC